LKEDFEWNILVNAHPQKTSFRDSIYDFSALFSTNITHKISNGDSEQPFATNFLISNVEGKTQIQTTLRHTNISTGNSPTNYAEQNLPKIDRYMLIVSDPVNDPF